MAKRGLRSALRIWSAIKGSGSRLLPQRGVADFPAQGFEGGVPGALRLRQPLLRGVETGEPPDSARGRAPGNVDVRRQTGRDHRANADDPFGPHRRRNGVGPGIEGAFNLLFQSLVLIEESQDHRVRLLRLRERADLVARCFPVLLDRVVSVNEVPRLVDAQCGCGRNEVAFETLDCLRRLDDGGGFHFRFPLFALSHWLAPTRWFSLAAWRAQASWFALPVWLPAIYFATPASTSRPVSCPMRSRISRRASSINRCGRPTSYQKTAFPSCSRHRNRTGMR